MEKEKNKKIFFVANTSWSLWNFRLGIMHTLKKEGYEIYCLAPQDEFSEKLSKEFKFIHINNLERKGMNPLTDISLFIELLKKYRKIKPDLVFNFTIKPNIYSSLACRALRIKCISMVTGLGYGFMGKGILKMFLKIYMRISLARNEQVIFLNQEDADYFMNNKIVKAEKIQVFPGEGIDTDFFNPSFCNSFEKNGKISFLMISRLLYDKGVVEFAEAAKKVKNKFPDAEFLLLGPKDTGNPSSINEKELYDWEKSGIIKYLGTSDDVRPFICNSSAIVLPSYKEGLPRTLLEAMSMEKPIIATNIPGSRDLVQEGENGFLVEVKNSDSLADAMEKFINIDTVQKNEMGKKGREIALQKFDEKIIISKYLEII